LTPNLLRFDFCHGVTQEDVFEVVTHNFIREVNAGEVACTHSQTVLNFAASGVDRAFGRCFDHGVETVQGPTLLSCQLGNGSDQLESVRMNLRMRCEW
jgi:hypothetical protein